MHRTAVVLALLALPLSTGPASGEPLADQLRSGGFEEWTSAGVPANWTLEIGNVYRSAIATEGASSAQLRAKPNLDGTHFSILAQTIPQSDTDAPIVPGAWYELAYDASGSYAGKGYGRASVTWTGAFGHVLRVDVVDVPEGSFQAFAPRFQAPIDPVVSDAATVATIRFLVDGQSSDDKVNLWIDHARFGPAPPPVG